MHGPEICENIPDPKISPPDRERGRPTKLGHPIQDVARDQRFSVLSLGVPSTKPVANDGLVPEEGVLGARLSMIAGTRALIRSAKMEIPDKCVIRGRQNGNPG